MPKMKSHRGAAKRFKRSGSGKLFRRKGYKSHLLTHKSSKRKRYLRKGTEISASDEKRVARLLPY